MQAIRYLVVSEICDAAMAALGRNDTAQAGELTERARQLDLTHPDAIRIAALLSLHRGRPCEAVDLLERAGSTLASMRLLLQLARLQAGQHEAAHLDLHAWSRQDACSTQARQLLAYLEHQSADDAAACASLQRNIRRQPDPASVQMRWLLDQQAGRRDAARQLAAVMAQRLTHHRATGSFRRLMGLGELSDTQVPMEMIDQLAGELIDQPQVIASLVAAQKHRAQPQRIYLLRRALGRIVDDLPRPLEAILALSELALLAGDADDAKRWAQRGLRLDAYHARLALLLDQADRTGDNADADQARAALRRAAAVHSDYRDLRAALNARLTGGMAA